MVGEPQAPQRGRRPRDRKDHIIRAAGELFHRTGYHLVTMSEVADAVGITSSALYRHVRNKHDLLHEAIVRAVDGYTGAVRTGLGDGLDTLVDRLVLAALDWRDVGMLWQREARHLTQDERAALRVRLWDIAVSLARGIRVDRPDLEEHEAELLAASLLSVLTSLSYHKVTLGRSALVRLLRGAAMATLGVNLVSRPAAVEHREPEGAESPLLRTRALHRERLLTLAVRQFARAGYAAVTLEDIAAAAGVTGPSIYAYFQGKDALLSVAVLRGANWLHTEMSRILQEARSADEALRSLLTSYAGFAYGHRDVVQLLVSELGHLPSPQREEARQGQRDYVVEWVTLLRAARPELDRRSAQILVHAALTVANDVARTRRFRRRTDLMVDIAAVGRAVLFDSPAPNAA